MAQSKLLNQLTDTIRTRHYSIRTEQAYIKWVKNFILFHNKRHPVEMGSDELNSVPYFPGSKMKGCGFYSKFTPWDKEAVTDFYINILQSEKDKNIMLDLQKI